MKIADVQIGARHRSDMGDLDALAEDIRRHGLLSPIGVTEGRELVFGERRLRACRDALGWTEIDVRVVNVPSIVAGEFAENEMRKAFTVSERVAIFQTMRLPSGGDRRSISFQNPDLDFENNDVKSTTYSEREQIKARLVGFGSHGTATNAIAVVKRGCPELVAAVDRGEIGVATAAKLTKLPPDEQRAALILPKSQREARAKRAKQQEADDALKTRRAKTNQRSARQIAIPWSGRQAATLLIARWPRSLVEDLSNALLARLRLSGPAGDTGHSAEPERVLSDALAE